MHGLVKGAQHNEKSETERRVHYWFRARPVLLWLDHGQCGPSAVCLFVLEK